MDKANKHPYEGATVYLGTKHGKASALAPHFFKIGMRCQTIEVDTDAFGTFTGEIERKGSVRETLRKKVNAVLDLKPDARFVLASEGSFGPHPYMGFLQSDHEVLLFFDKQTEVEIFADELSVETNHHEIEFGPKDDLQGFLDKIKFPSHAIIARPKGNVSQVFKGIKNRRQLGQAIIECFLMSKEAKAVLSTDMRASFNPTRMSVISKAGERLLSRLTCFCRACSATGFGPIKGIRGLPCSDCGLPTQVIKEILYGCVACDFEDVRESCDGLKFASPAECDFCNP